VELIFWGPRHAYRVISELPWLLQIGEDTQNKWLNLI